MSKFFINRPNLAWVVAIFISLAGLLALPNLPIAQYPTVAPPQILITANYPGASAQTINESVTSLIEEELNGAKGLLYYESTSSSSGQSETYVTFAPGTDPDLAQVDVQNRIKRVEARLPSSVTQQGLQVEQASSNFLLIYTLTYKNGDKDPVGLADYAARNVNNEIRRVAGVGRVQMFGSERAMRVWIDPAKLVGFGLSPADVNNAIASQNVQVPAGSIGAQPGTPDQQITATVMVRGQLQDPEEFGNIVLRANEDGSVVKLSDVAEVVTGSQDYTFNSQIDGKAAAGVAVQLAPGANALATAEGVKARLAELSNGFPADIEYATPYDTSVFVKVAIEKVVYTLLEAIALVFVVMFLFLQNFRYTFIPIVVVPVCLLGTLGVMLLLGFSINMMTMFGMVLAIGILVDDAIVVVENVERIMAEEGLSPKEATLKAMSQISGAIVGITLVLAAVFLPLAFMSGSVGIVYRQFSISLAVSIMFSGFLALTMTPALCATLLKPIAKGHHEKKGFFGWFNRKFSRLTNGYASLNNRSLKRVGRCMVVYAALIAVLAFAYGRLPSGFLPVEDQGYIMVDTQLAPGATLPRTKATIDEIGQVAADIPSVSSTLSIMGFSFSGSGQNAGLSFVMFKDWAERSKAESAESAVNTINARFAEARDGTVFAVSPPPVEGMGNSNGFSLRLQDRAGLGREALLQARDQLMGKAYASESIAYVAMEGLADAPEIELKVDRDKAQALGIAFDAINTTLSTAFGSSQINEFANVGRMQRVIVQARPDARTTPEDLKRLYVPNRSGELVPLDAFTEIAWSHGPVQVVRYNGYPGIKLMGDAKPGYSSGQAMAEMERLAAELPPGIGYEWTGLSFQEKASGAQAPIVIGLALLVVFLLLVGLYESWSIPFSVMLIVPIGALGAVGAVTLFNMPNDVYFKVGLITIIGLAAKNAILIIEFAKDLRAQGRSAKEAAMEAARIRFRPIIMTSIAFILGVVPLAIASGAGAASQRAIGTGVIGGMLTATILGVLFVPIFYVWVQSMTGKKAPAVDTPNTPAQEAK
ncbi:efflux RND transporter permease subunit [Schauerella aestuarii]|uniref:efflux RND transporter permease subunit n=1 Tax=Schauerella aestuarii TaxID=2511204 RepID=UPI00136D672C|nr:efflux RND transporter permease subunit [Achromobacter aestuarii]MYZ43323.1 multidrug efflux RND transporter permease subunit [Achromobacter aestuarii]